MFLKKWGLLLIATVLVLTGCANEASLVRDAFAASFDKPNYDYKSTMKLTGDFSDLLKLAENEKEGKEAAAFIHTLQEGITFEGSILDAHQAKTVITLHNDQLLRHNNLWSSDQKASAELLFDNDNLYVTSPLDDKYLRINPNASFSAEEQVDQQKLKSFQEKANELTLAFFKKYISKFGYKLAQAKNHGTTTVQLPNGESVKATHVSIVLDMKELIKMAMYIAKDSTSNPDVKSFAVDLTALSMKFADETNPENSVKTDAEYRAEAEKTVSEVLQKWKEEVDRQEKLHTPESMVESAKKEGLEALTLSLDYYIDERKMPVHSTSKWRVTLNNIEELKKPLSFALEFDSYAWNFGKATPFEIPAKEKVVALEEIATDKQKINEFHNKGFLYAILKEFHKQSVFIIFDLNDRTTHMNGEQIKGVHPYLAKGTTMVPLGFIAKEMGAAVKYDPKTKTAALTKENTTIAFTAGSNVVKVNGTAKKLAVPVALQNGRLYVPLSVIRDELGARVDWIDTEKQVIVEFDKYE